MKDSHKPLYDLKELRTISSGDELFFHEMITLFIDQSESAVQDIKHEFASGNHAKVVGILHKIKPSVMVMGVNSVAEMIQQIEHLEFSENNKPTLTSLLTNIEKILLDVTSQLKQI